MYDKIVAVGEGHGLVHAGLKALASLRMEKGYRDYGHDLDNTDTLLEAGLGFTADFDKPGGFIGREAVLAQKESVGGSVAKLPKRMIQVVLEDPEPFLHHGEVVYRDGEIVGDVRAGSFGHTVRHATRPFPEPQISPNHRWRRSTNAPCMHQPGPTDAWHGLCETGSDV